MSKVVKPYKASEKSKKEQVAEMFDNISGKYDFLNHFLSFGIDHYWRRKTISILKNESPQLILDVATGTGDLAFSAHKRLKPKKIIGLDISNKMDGNIYSIMFYIVNCSLRRSCTISNWIRLHGSM